MILAEVSSGAISSAWTTVAEWGIVGAILCIILAAFLVLVNRTMNRFEARFDQNRDDEIAKAERVNKILSDKDDKLEAANKEWREKLEKANEKSNQVAIDAVKVGTIMGERQSQLIGLLEEVLELLRRNNGHDQPKRNG